MKIHDYYYATGRKKNATARAFLKPGTGIITVNDKPLDKFIQDEGQAAKIAQIFTLLKCEKTYDIKVTVKGGGYSCQTDAIKFAITYTLNEISDEYHDILKKNGYLRRDTRIKERRKAGLKKARKAPQFSKR